MPKKRFSPEQIIATLRQIEVHLAQVRSIALACKEVAISEQNSGTSVSSWRSSTA
jgi:putative transposase